MSLDDEEPISSEQLTEFVQVFEEELVQLSQDIEEKPIKGKDQRKSELHSKRKVQPSDIP